MRGFPQLYWGLQGWEALAVRMGHLGLFYHIVHEADKQQALLVVISTFLFPSIHICRSRFVEAFV